jgi:hypothetical protein
MISNFLFDLPKLEIFLYVCTFDGITAVVYEIRGWNFQQLGMGN